MDRQPRIERDPDLAAQAIEGKAFDQRFGLIGLAIEQQIAAAIGPDHEIEQHLALRAEQGGPARQWAGDVVGDQSLQKAQRYDQAMQEMQNLWQKDLGRIDLLPTLLPIAGDFAVTSGFGFRVDPLSRLPSMHEGIDFVAPVGTPVLSTAPGVVLVAEYSGAYGKMVDIQHAEGFVTRYAHLQAIHVQAGQIIAPHQTVGTLGNTGRSTGPHLHYEVIFNGRALHPVKALAAWSRS